MEESIETVCTNAAPLPAGHYAQAVVANGLIFVSGQLPLLPGSEGQIPAGIEAQTRTALENVGEILQAAGSGLNGLLSVTIFVTDIRDWPAVNRVFAEVLGKHRPARAVAVSPQLHFGALIEIQAIALVLKN
jgi:2-iminobutanoate/2-iminopropanoate deaminase